MESVKENAKSLAVEIEKKTEEAAEAVRQGAQRVLEKAEKQTDGQPMPSMNPPKIPVPARARPIHQGSRRNSGAGRGALVKIATWNVNSIKARLPHLLAWLRENAPDAGAVAGDESGGRGVSFVGDRRPRLQHRGGRSKSLQRRRRPIEAAHRDFGARPSRAA